MDRKVSENMYKKFLWSGLAIALLFAPIARGAVRVWSITPVLLIEATLIFIWLWKANNQEGYIFKRTAIDKPILIFALLAAISFVFSIYKHDSLYSLLQLFGYIGIYYLVVNEFDHDMRKRILGLVICIGTGLSAYGILQYFGLFRHGWWEPKDLLAATYVNHNNFAGYLELVIPLAVGMFLKSQRISLVTALVILVTAFILAQSRGAWLSLGISFLAISPVLIRKEKPDANRLLTMILIIIIIASFAYFGKDIISQRISAVSIAGEEEASLKTRLMIWKGSLDMIRHNSLVGTGIGTFIWGFPRYRPEGLNVQANFAHNDYLEVAAEMGIAAVFVMIWILAMIIKNTVKKPDVDPVKLGLAIGVLSLSLHGLVDFNFHIPANMLLFTVYAAMVMKSDH